MSQSSARSIQSLASQHTSLKSILILSSHLRLSLHKGLFPSCSLTNILYAFLNSSIRAKCPAHLSPLDLRFLIILGEKYNACSSKLCNFLHSAVISSLLVPNIFLSIIILHVLTFSFLEYNGTVLQLPSEVAPW